MKLIVHPNPRIRSLFRVLLWLTASASGRTIGIVASFVPTPSWDSWWKRIESRTAWLAGVVGLHALIVATMSRVLVQYDRMWTLLGLSHSLLYYSRSLSF